jgi:hypothetical protein
MITPGRMLPCLVLVLLCGGLARPAPAADDVRFSATLTPKQRAGTGLAGLDPDHVAVIDGLVRQDEAASKFKDNAVDHTRFSQRRTAPERALAGLAALTPGQLAQLDELVRQRIAGPAPEPAAAMTRSAGTAGTGVKSVTGGRPLEIHGEISYTYGWSQRGSYQGGGLVLTYDDPARRYSLLVGYAEYHGKGLPWCFYPGGVPYRPYPGSPP